MERMIPLKFKNADGTFIVLPDDAHQLCGYDITGDEIYEGDKLLRVLEVVEATPEHFRVEAEDYLTEYAVVCTGTTYSIWSPEVITEGGYKRLKGFIRYEED